MSKKTSAARHRAVPTRTNPLAAAGKPAVVAVAVSGIMLGAALPAQASGEIQVAPAAAQQYSLQSVAAPIYTAPVYTAPVAAPVYTAPVTYTYTAPVTYTAASQAAPAVAQSNYSFQAPAGAINPITNGGVVAPAPAAPIAPAAPVAGNGITGTAMQGEGGSYVYGGTGFKAWDCSGFVQWVYAQNGISLPRTTWSQFAALRPTSNPQPGDLVSQNGGSHVGIYLGNGKMISALNPSQGTLVHDVSAMQVDGYYTR